MILRVFKSLACALAAGLLAAFANPPDGHWVFAVAAVCLLLSLLWSFEKPSARKGFILAWLAGLAAFATELRWLSVVSPLGAVVLPLYLGLFWGLFGAFAATLGNPFRRDAGAKSHLAITFANAAVWALLEWLRGWLFTGFGWNGLGIAFHETLPLVQIADLLGAAGISLMLVWICGLAVTAWKSWRREKSFKGWHDPIAAAALVILILGYGFFRIHQEKGLETTPLKALLVQVNIPQDAAQKLWDPAEIHMAYEDDTLTALEKAKADGNFPDWVIWPESALSGAIMRTDDDGWGTWEDNMVTIRNVRAAGNFTLLYGVNEIESEQEKDGSLVQKEDGKAYNSLAVMSPEDELQTFRKHHLVIFGETIPFVDSIPLLKKIYEQQAGVEYHGSFSEGTSFEPLQAKADGRTVGIIPSVCFEDTVPRLLRRFVKPGPQVIVNVTNDGWFKDSIAASQHYANARFRAIELRRPMIRCANTGVTVALTGTGSTADPKTGRAQLLTGPPHGDHFTRNSMIVNIAVPIHPPTTLYALMGDWGVILLGVGSFTGTIVCRRRGKSAPSPLN